MQIIKTLTLALLAFLLVHSSYGQQHLVDSIENLLQQPMADSDRAMSMMRLAIDYEVVDTAKAYQRYREAVEFATKKELHYQLGRILQNQAFLYSTASNYPKSRELLEKAIESYDRSTHTNAKKYKANAYGDIANGLRNQNDVKQSIEYHLKSIEQFEELGQYDQLVTRYCNVANLFSDLREFDKQHEYALKALDRARRSPSRINLHLGHLMVAHSFASKDDPANAKPYLDTARQYFNPASNIDIHFTHNLIAANIFKKLNMLDSALYFFNQCLVASTKYHYSYGIAESQVQMGAIAILQKNYPEAERYLLSGLKDAESMNVLTIMDTGYKYLSDVYLVTGRYQDAYTYFVKYKELNDSLMDERTKQYASELEKKYEAEKKDKRILMQQAELSNQKIFTYIGIAAVIVLVIILLLLLRTHQQRQSLQKLRISELENEKKLMATEAVLKGEEQERTRMAKDLHDGLGGMLSGIKHSFRSMKENLIMTPENQLAFERSMDMLDGSIQEMRRVAHNMMPEALVRFGFSTALQDYCKQIHNSGTLAVTCQTFGLEKDLDQTVSITLYRVIQELMSNIIKHASAKTALVQVSRTEGKLTVTVEDDGAGFDTSILEQSKGIGWTNILHRIEFLQGKVDIHSTPGGGTSVHIELNN